MNKTIEETTAKGLLIATTIGLTYLAVKKISTMLRRSMMAKNVTNYFPMGPARAVPFLNHLEDFVTTGVYKLPIPPKKKEAKPSEEKEKATTE